MVYIKNSHIVECNSNCLPNLKKVIARNKNKITDIANYYNNKDLINALNNYKKEDTIEGVFSLFGFSDLFNRELGFVDSIDIPRYTLPILHILLKAIAPYIKSNSSVYMTCYCPYNNWRYTFEDGKLNIYRRVEKEVKYSSKAMEDVILW